MASEFAESEEGRGKFREDANAGAAWKDESCLMTDE